MLAARPVHAAVDSAQALILHTPVPGSVPQPSGPRAREGFSLYLPRPCLFFLVCLFVLSCLREEASICFGCDYLFSSARPPPPPPSVPCSFRNHRFSGSTTIFVLE
jgi:hypothetical protein